MWCTQCLKQNKSSRIFLKFMSEISLNQIFEFSCQKVNIEGVILGTKKRERVQKYNSKFLE